MRALVASGAGGLASAAGGIAGAAGGWFTSDARSCSARDQKIHIIFSTGCNKFQHWQAQVLLHSALSVGQCGRITRIVSGCEEREDKGGTSGKRWITHQGGKTDELVPVAELSMSSNPNFDVHVTPMIPEAKEFPWWNKPYSIAHWTQNGNLRDDETVVILDPDEFFLRPLSQDGSPWSDVLASGPVVQALRGTFGVDVAEPGRPVAQYYGLGDAWLHKFDVRSICGDECARITPTEADTEYSVGPPYILHASDMRKVGPLWIEYMKPVYKADRGDMQADMYAYIMAAAKHNLKHTRLDHFMVSDESSETEAWPWIERISNMSCRKPLLPPTTRIPPLVHSAQHYKANSETGELWNFHKGHIPGQILECGQPLIVAPPDNLFNTQTEKIKKREAFMVCQMTYLINEAVLAYKKKYCKPPEINYKQCVRLVVHRQEAPKCGTPGNPDCYPLAKRVC